MILLKLTIKTLIFYDYRYYILTELNIMCNLKYLFDDFVEHAGIIIKAFK